MQGFMHFLLRKTIGPTCGQKLGWGLNRLTGGLRCKTDGVENLAGGSTP